MKQPRDSKGRFLPKPKPKEFILKQESTSYTEQDVINAFKAGVADSGRGLLLPQKKAEMYLANLKRHT